MMGSYLTLSYDYSPACLEDRVILYNNLNGKVFTVEGENAGIIRELVRGVYEQKLREEYGDLWIELRKSLVDNSALIDCEPGVVFFDSWDYGGVHVLSRDRSRVTVVRELVVQYATSCSLDCPNCGEALDMPCLGCSCEHTTASLANETIVSVVSQLLSHGLEQLTLAGADPLIRSEDLFELAEEVKAVAPNVLICVRTNGSRIMNSPALQDRWPANSILELLPVGEEGRFSDDLLQNLKERGIRCTIARRAKKTGLEIDVRAEDLEAASTLQSNTVCVENKPCVYQRGYVSASGDVSSCRGYSLRGQKLGNVLNDDLGVIVRRLESSWKAGESDREECSVCPWRGHCVVCPALRSAPGLMLHCESPSAEAREGA